jgi:hypothetical protein
LLRKIAVARSARVKDVSRRKRLGGNRSTASRMSPPVSWVSTAPSTLTLNSSSGPSAVKTWVKLPNASSWATSLASAETSMRQSITY